MSLLNRLKAWWGSSEPAIQKLDSDKPDLEVPRYPPFMTGLPAVAPQRLIDSQRELLVHLDRVVIVSSGLYEKHYKSVLHRFASYCHLLPASQAHHHRGAGGLLRHSIEVGLWAAQASDKLLLDLAKTPAQRRQIEPRWQATAFLAGLCHDVGKPATDIIVTSADRTHVWKPLTQNLSDWATEHRIKSYFLDWRAGRAKQHIALSNLLAERIIGIETLTWIEEGGTELVIWLMEALNANPGARNPLYDLVVKADQASVDRDMKSMGVAMAGYEIGVPVERHLTDIMRRLIKEGVWTINVPGARVWNIDGAIFVVWPAAGEEIARLVREDGIPGIPRTGDGILDMLVERQLAFVRDSEDGDKLWKISPDLLITKDGKKLKLPCIRLKNDAMIASSPLPAVTGKVLNGEHAQESGESETHESQPQDTQNSEPVAVVEERPIEPAKAPEPTKQPSSKSKQAQPAQSNTPPETAIAESPAPEAHRAPAEMIVDQQTGEVTAMKVTQADGTQRVLKMRKAELEGKGKAGVSSPVALRLKPKSTEANAASADTGEQLPAQQNAQASNAVTEGLPLKAKEKKKAISLSHKPTIEFDGAVGALFQALVDDIKTGSKRWGLDLRLDDEMMVHMKWPAAFSGYGLSPKNILDECSQKKWIWIDPYAPMVRLVDSEFEGAPCKALRLNPEASYAFIFLARYTGESAANVALQAMPKEEEAASSSASIARESVQSSPVTEDEEIPPHMDEVPPDLFDSAPPIEEPPPQKSKPVRDKDSLEQGKHAQSSSNAKQKPQQPPKNGHNGAAATHKPEQPQNAGTQKVPQQQAKSTTEPLPNKNPFQATKFDKFIAIIGAMEGAPTEDGWISLGRSDCMAACKSQGIDISRRELQSFCEYASDALKVMPTRILLKKKGL